MRHYKQLIKEAREIVKKHHPVKYEDRYLPETWEKNIGHCTPSELKDAILIAEYQSGLRMCRDPKKIVRLINRQINYN
jgi:hypothetical protein